MNHDTRLPLDGIRVIEFTHMVMGPTCGMILADLGAEVIKIEPPGGDKTRNLPGLGIGFFRSFNRNKKSVVLDLHTPEGKQAAVELIGTCDVMLENFRPGLMATLGLDYDTLSARYPALVYVTHKGFLPGPYDRRLALDEVVQMMGGLSHMTGPVGRPLRAGTSVNDIMGGMFGAIGVLAAARTRTHRPRAGSTERAVRELRVPVRAAHAAIRDDARTAAADAGARVGVERLRRSRSRTANSCSSARSATGSSSRCATCSRAPETAAEPEFATNAQRVAVRPRLLERLGAILKDHRAAELSPKLEAAGIPYAPIVRPEQLLDDPHLKASGGLVPMQTDDGHTTDVVLLPITMGGRRPGVRQALARVGEHAGSAGTADTPRGRMSGSRRRPGSRLRASIQARSRAAMNPAPRAHRVRL